MLHRELRIHPPAGPATTVYVPRRIAIELWLTADTREDVLIVLRAGNQTSHFEPGTRLEFRARTLGEAIEALASREEAEPLDRG